MIDSNLNDLVDPFKLKAKVFLSVVRLRYPNVVPFETRRSKLRQVQLLATGKTWTLNSKHLIGKAVDRVFMVNGQPSRKGDYYFLQWIAVMCGMERIKQELCHTQDNGLSIGQQMANNSARYNETHDGGEQNRLHAVNDAFHKALTPTT